MERTPLLVMMNFAVSVRTLRHEHDRPVLFLCYYKWRIHPVTPYHYPSFLPFLSIQGILSFFRLRPHACVRSFIIYATSRLFVQFRFITNCVKRKRVSEYRGRFCKDDGSEREIFNLFISTYYTACSMDFLLGSR